MPSAVPSVIPMIAYEEGAAALDWQARAFGFRELSRSTGCDGRLAHGEMEAGDGRIMLASPTPDYEGPEPEDGPPARRYRVEDLEGHRWMFMQR